MQTQAARRYQAHEFAQRAGVTVRTLHHYDRLGLLKPSDRTEAGYRLYGEREMLRLQQIATLKLVGFPLKQIRALLERGPTDLPATLRLQRQIVDQKRRQLEVAGRAIDRAERLLVESGTLDWDDLREILEVIEMQDNWEFVKGYYTEEQLAELAERNRANPGLAEQGQRDWAELIAEVEAAVAGGESPTSEHAQLLAARWSGLIEAFTGGNPAIAAGLKRLYADQANWPATAKPPYDEKIGAFIREVNARK